MKPLLITKKITNRDGYALDVYLKEVSKIKMLTKSQEKEIAIRAFKGDKSAIDKLTRSNLRFAISIAKQYQNNKVPLIELINAANQGIYESAKTFDPYLGNKFISYAVWNSRSKVIEHLNKYSKTIYIPSKKKDKIRHLKGIISRLEQKYEREPNTDEIYESIKDIYTYKQFEKLMCYCRIDTISYDSKYIEGDLTLLDTLKNEDLSDNNILNKEKKDTVKLLLKSLPRVESDIIKALFGIGCDKQDMKSIAKDLNISPNKVSDIKSKIIRKLSLIIKNYYE